MCIYFKFLLTIDPSYYFKIPNTTLKKKKCNKLEIMTLNAAFSDRNFVISAISRAYSCRKTGMHSRPPDKMIAIVTFSHSNLAFAKKMLRYCFRKESWKDKGDLKKMKNVSFFVYTYFAHENILHNSYLYLNYYMTTQDIIFPLHPRKLSRQPHSKEE